MPNSFLAQFATNINFSYSCYDRMVIRGYIGKLYLAGQMVIVMRAMGYHAVSEALLWMLTHQLRRHIDLIAEKHNIPVLWWPTVIREENRKRSKSRRNKRGKSKKNRRKRRKKKGLSPFTGKNGDKLRYVEKHYIPKNPPPINYTYCIIGDMEKTRTFKASKNSRNKNKPWFIDDTKLIKHYYIYFHDKYLGLCRLKICTFCPFTCEFYFNGHNALQIQLDKQGIEYTRKDNAFTSCSDPVRLQELAQILRGRLVQDRIRHWMSIYFKFRKDNYSTCSKYLRHEWYLHQTEVCSNVVFKSARFGTNLFKRLMDKHYRMGTPDRMSLFFGKKRCRGSESTSTYTSYGTEGVQKYWLSRNSIKIYNKFGTFIRVETTINSPQEAGLKKPLIYLQSYFWYGYGCNDRFQNTLADVDVNTIADNEPDTFLKPVEVEGGRRVAALDTRKERPVALMHELLNPKYTAVGFTTNDILHALPGYFRNIAQIRYELDKLRARRMVAKRKHKSFYSVTEAGYKSIYVLISSASYFRDPLLATVCGNRDNRTVAQPSKLESGFITVMEGLDQCVQALDMIH